MFASYPCQHGLIGPMAGTGCMTYVGALCAKPCKHQNGTGCIVMLVSLPPPLGWHRLYNKAGVKQSLAGNLYWMCYRCCCSALDTNLAKMHQVCISIWIYDILYNIHINIIRTCVVYMSVFGVVGCASKSQTVDFCV